MAAALACPALASAQAPPSTPNPSTPSPSTPDQRDPSQPPVETGEQISLSEALAEATGQHPNIEQAKADLRAASAQRKQARAHFGPTLSASASAQLWDDEITFSAAPGGGGSAPQLPPPQTPYEEVIAGLFANSEPTTIRSQFTWDVSLTISQPLGPLWSIYHGYKAAEYGEDAAQTQVDQATRDQARNAAVAYFRVLQARASLDTAMQSVEQLQAQVDRVRALVDAGAAKHADQLRIEVALASAKQQVSQTRAQLKLARSALAVAINRDPQHPVGASSIDGVDLPSLTGQPSDAVDEAIQARPELQQLELRKEQADEGVEVAKGEYIPQLIALGQYQHTEGQGLTGSNNAFVGLSLDWTIWSWGSRYYAIDEAQAQRVKLDSVYTQTRRQIGLQVKQAWYDLQSALEAYSVAQKAVEQAKEAYRVESVRYDAGESTPTDLLDAQSALTEAQNNRNAALYQALIKNAELIYSTGKPLTAGRLIEGEK